VSKRQSARAASQQQPEPPIDEPRHDEPATEQAANQEPPTDDEPDDVEPPVVYQPVGTAPALVNLDLPITLQSPTGFCRKHVQVQLDARQARLFRQIHAALDQQGARLANGRRINHAADVLRWILDQVDAAVSSNG